jgi:hypothetical protein
VSPPPRNGVSTSTNSEHRQPDIAVLLTDCPLADRIINNKHRLQVLQLPTEPGINTTTLALPSSHHQQMPMLVAVAN